VSGRRVAMISGGNRGIGAAIASALAERGWLLSLGVRAPDRVREAGDALVHRYDAREPRSERAWVAATVSRFGRIDAVVNNAGIMIPKSVVEATDPDLDAILEVNVKAPLRLVREAWPHLTAHGEGRVVTIVSLSGKRVKTAGSGLYAVSKFAALGLAHAIRHAGWEKGVRSTALCPGLVATDMARGLTSMPPEDMTRPEDLARIVALLLELPNTASVAEIPINALLDEAY
jgi:NAD(P)-dependent dehydrogenase (short-subunit alcohol dehydrogenase family)